MCPPCQLYLLDPLSIPVMTLIEPFFVLRGSSDNEEKFPNVKEFEL